MLVNEMVQLGAKRSGIRELFEYGLKRKAEVGAENVFDFSIGNPSVPAPEAVLEEIARQAAREDSVKVHGYTSAAGAMSVREAVAKNLNERFHCGARAQNLFFTCGAAPAVMSVLKSLSVPDAEIVILAPYFPEYTTFIRAAGCKPVIVPANTKDFDLHVDEVEPYVTAHTQAIIINSPNNPTGIVYHEEALRALGDMLRKKGEAFGHPIYIIADEPYRELVYDGRVAPFIPNIYENTIVCYSWSKSLSLPGERIGYVYVPDQCADSENVFYAVAGSARAMGHVCAPTTAQYVVEKCCGMMPDIAAYDENRKTL
ncbi:MAG: pyridoxal phosphate-dependent aminotransferase, partial [Clostridia bacterium]|nr:pyridoxal phosphate-dependent aminotransferase [Clostridia bacterium]